MGKDLKSFMMQQNVFAEKSYGMTYEDGYSLVVGDWACEC